MTIAEANEPLSNELKQIIARKGLKNLYVAENAGYTAQELSDMLNGRRLIKACDIPKIAKALGVEINYLFGIEKGAQEKMLKSIPTKELVEELKKREGVKAEYAEPYQDKVISINGPAMILIVID